MRRAELEARPAKLLSTGAIASGIVAIGLAALILALSSSFISVLFAELLHGLTAGIVTPAIGAINLGLVGRQTMSLRTGRNYRYAASGHAATAILMGVTGTYYSASAMFVAAATLCVVPIQPNEIDYARARNAAKKQETRLEVGQIFDMVKNKPLVLFASSMHSPQTSAG